MTGTGVQNDPYIVYTWEEFVEAVGTTGAYVEFPKQLVKTTDEEVVIGKKYFSESGEIIASPVTAKIGSYYENAFEFDLNSVEDLTSTINIKCTQLNGNYGAIRNMFADSISVFAVGISLGNTTINGINFLNIYEKGNSILLNHSANSSTINLNDCIFAGILNDNSCILKQSNYSHLNYKRCSFNVLGYGNSEIVNTAQEERYSAELCHFNFNIQAATPIDNGKFKECRFDGVIHNENVRNSCNFLNNENCSDNIFNVEFTNSSPTLAAYNQRNFINTDILAEGTTTPTGFILATQEEIDSPSFLASHGFPVAGE